MKTTQKGSLAVSALTKFLVGVVAVATLLFAPAGSLGYVGAWRLLAVLFIPMIIFGLAALISSPDLLARRLKSKEERTTQSGVVRLSGLLFVVGFVVAGLDYRFGWSNVSQTTIWIACGVFIVGYLLYAEVMRDIPGENTAENIQVIIDETERLAAGDCHYCPKGGFHTLINDGDEDLVFFAVVPQQ